MGNSKRSGRGADPARLEAFIKQSGLSYWTNSRSYIFTCPLCRKEDKLYIQKSNGRFICFVCAETTKFQGAPEYAFRELTGQSLSTIRTVLYGASNVQQVPTFLDIRLHDFLEDEEFEVVPETLPETSWPYHCYPLDHQWSLPGVKYLQGRGIPLNVALEYDIRYSPPNRSIAFPVWVGTRLAGWQYRIIDEIIAVGNTGEVNKRLKALTEGEIKGNCVMFSNRLSDVQHAVLCEGPIDALKAHMVGGNVCTMGKAITNEQVTLLIRSGVRRIYLALDPDAAAEIDPLLVKIGKDAEVLLVEIPKPYKDLGEMTIEMARDVILSAKPLKLGHQLHVYFKGEDLVRTKTMK